MYQIVKGSSNTSTAMEFVSGPFTYNEAVKQCYKLNRAETSEMVVYSVQLYMPIRREKNGK